MQRRVLAGFDHQWPDFNLGVACFEMTVFDNGLL